MKQTKLFALLLALLMTLSFAGCLVKEDEQATDAAPQDVQPTASVDTADYNPDAVAVELGSIRITAGEIEESYNYYISMLESYYGVEVTDEESILEYREMAITDLIHYYMPQWKAEQLGVTLTVEEEAEIAKSASEQTEQLRSDLICEYAYYYGGTEEQVDDVSLLTEEQYNLAMEQINAELTEYFYAGYTLEDYLSEQYANSIDDSRKTKLIEKLEAVSAADFTVSDEQIEDWYLDTLEAQKTSFDADPSAYRDQVEDFAAGLSNYPALYVPEGYLRVQLIEIAPEAERDLKIETNRAEMAELEAEYGRLALNDEDAERQAEILARYAELKAENETLEEAFLGEARTRINKAYEALEEETPFEDVMKAYNVDGSTESTLLLLEDDARYGELSTYAAELIADTYSEPLLINDVYYIVKLVETVPSGAVERATIADAIRAAAASQAQEDTWNDLYDAWEAEAEAAAVRHEDAYAAIGYLN